MVVNSTSRRARLAPPFLEFGPGDVARQPHLVEIIHAGAAEGPVGDRKARRFDDMGGHIQAGAQPQNRPGVLGDVGLEKRDLAISAGGPDECMNKTTVCADLVHCTLRADSGLALFLQGCQ